MADTFDPYYKWLAIPPDQQPPDHYRLLGITRYESDPDVISSAADQRMAHLRTFQSGPRSAESQRLLNEVSAAKIQLLNPEKRAAYDAKLRQREAETQAQSVPPSPPAGPAVPPPVAPPSVSDSVDRELGNLFASVGDEHAHAHPGEATAAPQRRPDRTPWLMAGGAIVVGLIAIAVAAVMLRPDDLPRRPTQPKEEIARLDRQAEQAPAAKADDSAHQPPSDSTPPADDDSSSRPSDEDPGEDDSTAAATPDPASDDRADNDDAESNALAAAWPDEAPPPAIAPFDAAKAEEHQRAWAEYLNVPVAWENSIGMRFALIPPGEFMMGSTAEEVAWLTDEGGSRRYRRRLPGEAPQHRVRITRPFWLGVTEVTQAQYQRIMGSNPSHFKGDPKRPVEEVTWHDSVDFCRRLSELPEEKAAERHYALPTEAQWEYACRAGDPGRRCFTAQPKPLPAAVEEKLLGQCAWFKANAGGKTHPVGLLRPSPWGLHDVYGNVWEWCQDWYDPGYYAKSPADDPPSPATGSARVIRGGGWGDSARYCRSANRAGHAPGDRGINKGFRVVCEIPREPELRLAFAEGAVEDEQADSPEEPADPEDTQTAANEPRELLPVPSKDEQNEVRRRIEGVFNISEAKTSKQKRKLAGDLARLGDNSDKPIEQYVLWLRAAELYCEIVDPRQTVELVDHIAEHFALPRLKAQLVMIKRLAENVQDEKEIKALVDVSGAIVDAAVAEERIDVADELTAVVYRACMKSAGRPFRPDALQNRRRIQALRDQYDKIEQARATLEEKPDDAAAHGVLGRWNLLQRKDWQAALPHLAKGDDEGLREAAQKELDSPPEKPEAQIGLADLWWDVGQKADDETMKRLLLGRAGAWYLQARSGIESSLMKTKIDQRLQEIEKAKADVPELEQSGAPPPALAPFDAKEAKGHQLRWARHLKVPVEWENSIGMKFVLIPPGEYLMGSTEEEVARLTEEGKRNNAPGWYMERLPNETPQHRVRITRPFWLGVTEVTQAQYQRIMGSNPSAFKDNPGLPVEQVSWNDCVDYCRRLSELPEEKAAERHYGLPTEAQWEHACRAGNPGRRWFSAQPNPLPKAVEEKLLGQCAWYTANAGGKTHPVGQLRANPWGLHDVYGNVWEWCQDWFDPGYYANSPADDPSGPDAGSSADSSRLARGGGWCRGAWRCRSAFRHGDAPDLRARHLGFRVACELNELENIDAFGDAAEASEAPREEALTEPADRRGLGELMDDTAARSGSAEEAIAAALKWFAEHQLPDGGWSFAHHLAPACRGKCANSGDYDEARIAATAFALRSFLGTGETHKKGKYKRSVEGGLNFLANRIKLGSNGASLSENRGTMYSHALATLALCEAYGITRDRDLLKPAQQAVVFICYAQDPEGGGWRYQPRQSGDTSVTGWQISALKTGELIGLNVPPLVFQRANQFLDSVSADNGAHYGYTRPGDGQATTAIGLLCRLYLGADKDEESLQRGVAEVIDRGPSTAYYYNYYATQLMRHWDREAWLKWKSQLFAKLLKDQATEGHAAGSWFSGGDHGTERGGRLYCTAMATLMLEASSSHLPIYGDDIVGASE